MDPATLPNWIAAIAGALTAVAAIPTALYFWRDRLEAERRRVWVATSRAANGLRVRVSYRAPDTETGYWARVRVVKPKDHGLVIASHIDNKNLGHDTPPEALTPKRQLDVLLWGLPDHEILSTEVFVSSSSGEPWVVILNVAVSRTSPRARTLISRKIKTSPTA